MIRLVPWGRRTRKPGDVPVAIISLDEEKVRRAALIDRGLPRDWVEGYWPATDMRAMSRREMARISEHEKLARIYAREILPGEVGCLLSHQAVATWLAQDESASWLVVLEDDVLPLVPDPVGTLTALLEALERASFQEGAFICHLGPREKQWKKSFSRRVILEAEGAECIPLYAHCDKKHDIWLAHAYVISREAASRYATSSAEKGFLADDWGRVIEETGIHLLSVFPGIFNQCEASDSSIDPGDERTRSHRYEPLHSVSRRNMIARGNALRVRLRSSLLKRTRQFAARLLRSLPAQKRLP